MKFLLSIFLGFAFVLSFQTVFALEIDSSKSANPVQTTVDYQLPYPGLLPDSPLYFLKVIRDKIINFLISDSLKKAEFDLLESDKRFNAAFYLLGKTTFSSVDKKKDLVVSTISKGENYFEEAIVKTREAKKQGSNTEDILKKLFLSNKKHQEILKETEKKLPQQERRSLVFLQKRIVGFEKEVNLLMAK